MPVYPRPLGGSLSVTRHNYRPGQQRRHHLYRVSFPRLAATDRCTYWTAPQGTGSPEQCISPGAGEDHTPAAANDEPGREGKELA
jgi:hypothetical protein